MSQSSLMKSYVDGKNIGPNGHISDLALLILPSRNISQLAIHKLSPSNIIVKYYGMCIYILYMPIPYITHIFSVLQENYGCFFPAKEMASSNAVTEISPQILRLNSSDGLRFDYLNFQSNLGDGLICGAHTLPLLCYILGRLNLTMVTDRASHRMRCGLYCSGDG